MKLIALVLLLAAVEALAQTSLTLTGLSYHVERDERKRAVVGSCEVNPGLGLKHALTEKLSVMAGGYRNSSCEESYYTGLERCWAKVGTVSFCSVLMLASGYERNPILAGGPTVRLEAGGLGYTLGFFPADRGVFWLVMDWRLR